MLNSVENPSLNVLHGIGDLEEEAAEPAGQRCDQMGGRGRQGGQSEGPQLLTFLQLIFTPASWDCDISLSELSELRNTSGTECLAQYLFQVRAQYVVVDTLRKEAEPRIDLLVTEVPHPSLLAPSQHWPLRQE